MSLRPWTDHVVPRLADASLRSHDIGQLREVVCADLRGDVLELGFGSGLNLRWLPDGVISVVAVEPSDVAWHLSEPRRERCRVPVARRGLDGQHLDLPDTSHDSALVTFSLCTIPDPRLALAEVRRVLRPGGTLHVLEHGLSPDAAVARRQRRLDRVQQMVAGGCHLTRDPAELLSATGWSAEPLHRGYLPGPSLARPWTWVSAYRASC
jgi:ubiquinone/menaquinone biosynthesis C-methylase UbiE